MKKVNTVTKAVPANKAVRKAPKAPKINPIATETEVKVPAVPANLFNPAVLIDPTALHPAIPAVPANPAEIKVTKVATIEPKVKTSVKARKARNEPAVFSVTEVREFFADGEETKSIKENNGSWNKEIWKRYRALNNVNQKVVYRISTIETKINKILELVSDTDKESIKEIIKEIMITL